MAEREQVDEIMMGVGRHPAWLRWVNPSIAQGVMARTDIAVTVFARGTRERHASASRCRSGWPAWLPCCLLLSSLDQVRGHQLGRDALGFGGGVVQLDLDAVRVVEEQLEQRLAVRPPLA